MKNSNLFLSLICLSVVGCVSPQIKHQAGSTKKANSSATTNQTSASASQNSQTPSAAQPQNQGAQTPAQVAASNATNAQAPAQGTNAAGSSDASPTPSPESQGNAPMGSAVAPTAMPNLVRPPIPRIGLILGPGGAKTYAHIAFLHELAKSKVPIHSVVGIEFSAPIAALFSKANSANDVEWQMFKLKDEDLYKKSLLGGNSKPSDASLLADSLKSMFQDQRAEGGRIPFMCPSVNLQKSQQFWMNRGQLTQVLPFCMAYPPLFKAYQGSIAGTRDVKAMADYLRKQGANVVVFVNVLSAPYSGSAPTEESQADEVLWSELAYLYRAPTGADLVLNLESGNHGIGSFSSRREIFQASKDSAQKAVNLLTHKLDL